MAHFSLFKALNTLFSRPQLRIVLSPERMKKVIETVVNLVRTRAGKVGLKLEREKKDEVEMVTEVVEKNLIKLI